MGRKAPTILRIGNIGNSGFSLIELLVAVAVLALGLVMLYEAFFSCLNAYSYSLSRLDAQRWMNEKIWEEEDKLRRQGILMSRERAGSFTVKNKNFTWKMFADLLEETEDTYLYRLRLEVFWKEAQRNVSLSQVAYVQN